MVKTGRRGQRGAALVETALILPLLFTLLVGAFEIGRLLYYYSVLSQLAYDGARLASKVSFLGSGCYRDFSNMAGDAPPADEGEYAHYVLHDTLNSEWMSVYGDSELSSYIPLKHEADNGEEDGPSISTMYVSSQDSDLGCAPSTPSGGGKIVEIVGVKLSGYVDGFFFPISFPIQAEHRAPFLLNSSNVRVRAGTGGGRRGDRRPDPIP